MCRNKSSHEANNPLATVDSDDRPRGASPPHESAGQSSERVVASAPWLRRQVNDIDPQECKESQTRDSSDVSEVCGDLWTHVPSEETQGTPLVVVMTRSTLGLDPSLSRNQPSPTPGCFSQDALCDTMRHMTWPQRTHPHACMCSPVNVQPQRVHAHLLLTSPTHDLVYKSSLYSETN